jgi:hypothetical protein
MKTIGCALRSFTVVALLVCGAGFLQTTRASSPQEEGRLYAQSDTPYDLNLLDKELQKIWGRMTAAAKAGDIDTLISYFALESQEEYRYRFDRMGPAALSNSFTRVEGIHVLEVYDHHVEGELLRTTNGTLYSFPITFIEEQEGVWKVRGM